MRSDELLAAMRLSAFIGDAAEYPDYSDARCLAEMSDVMKTVFTGYVVDKRSGYWLQSTLITTVSAQATYQLPDRATAGGVETVEYLDASGKFRRLDQLPEDQALDFNTQPAGIPISYVIRGNRITLLPAPSAGTPSLRVAFYLRPSRLVQPQSSTLAPSPNNVVRGLITAVNTGARTITVNAVPFDQELAVPAAITSAVQRIDVVHPAGSYEPVLVGATQTLSGTVFTVGAGPDMSDIQVGDYVRAAEQTDWPAVPEDYHRLVADITAIKVMTQLDLADKGQLLSAAAAGDIERLGKLLEQRVRSQPKQEIADPLVAAVRLAADIATDDPKYPLDRIYQELNDAMLSVFTDMFASARAGHWLRSLDVQVSSTSNRVQVPTRAASNGLEGLSIGGGAVATVFYPLTEISPDNLHRQNPVGVLGRPQYYYLQGDIVQLVPSPGVTSSLRFWTYLRPAKIVPPQNSTLMGGADRGRITAVGGTTTLTVNAVPFDMSLDIPSAITTGVQKIDVVRASGNFETVIASATQTLAGNVFTVSAIQGQTLNDVRVGDYVRVEDQTDWPALPREYHRLVADAAAVKILTAKGSSERAAALAQALGGDIARLRSQLQARVKNQNDGGYSGFGNSLTSAVRLAAGLDPRDREYPVPRLMQELTDALHTTIGDIVIKARTGMWLKSALFTTAAGTARYRIPDRALSGAVEAVELAADGLKYRPLAEIPESEAFAYESFGGQQDTPQYFVLRGDQIVLMPTPNAPLPMRVSFYLRPSVIFDSHWTTTLTNQQPANIGRVTAFNLNARTITVDVVPLDMGVIECPTAVASATQLIDVVHPGGNFEPLFIGATQTLAGSVFTITDASIDMSGIQVGDYVRAADQTDWPSVPREYHRLVCDLAGIRILRAKGDAKRADQLALATEPVLERFRSSLAPRVKSQPKIVPITTISRGRTRGWGAWS